MPQGKLNWVADFLYHPIAISQIEKMVISTQGFNRLHNILQNSTVYLTYPSMRTSRFSHSLGTMHLTGRIFRHSIINADEDTLKLFLDLLLSEILQYQKSSRFRKKLRSTLRGGMNRGVMALQCSAFVDPFYTATLPDLRLEESQRYALITTFQAIRLAALMHDLGHPPFSHVTELMLGQLYDELISLQEKGDQLTSEQARFIHIVSLYRREDKKFHELLGPELAGGVLNYVIQSCREQHKLCHDVMIVRYIILQIFKGREPIFQALRSIIDGEIDADRLDYVQRDLSLSGLSKAPLSDLERLITSYKLTLSNTPYDENELTASPFFQFLPSVRALSTIEEFYQSRFKLYQYVVFHHRAAKTDSLLRNVILTLAKDYLANETPPTTTSSLESFQLPNDISGLWKVLDPKEIERRGHFIFHYIQWDDAWLLSILRQHYFRMQDKQDSLLYKRLDEILSNQKSYFSLIKRADSFKAIDDAFLESLTNSSNSWLVKLATKLGLSIQESDKDAVAEIVGLAKDPETGVELAQVAQLFRVLVKYADVFQNIKERSSKLNLLSFTEMRETHGFFLVLLSDLLKSRGKAGRYGFSFMDSAIASWTKEFALEDVVVNHKPIKPGVTNDLALSMDNEVIWLGEVSSIAEELKRKARLTPPFYVYVYKTGGIESDTLLMRRRLGVHLFRAFKNWMQ